MFSGGEVKTDPYTFSNGTVADALEVNARYDPLYTLQNGGIDATNMDLTDDYAWTGTHTFSTVDINGGAIDGATIGGTTPGSGTFSDGAMYGQPLVFCKTLILPEYIQDETDFVPLMAVESGWAPNGITITKCGIKTDADSTYSVVFEKWSDPQTHSADLATVATSTSDEADSGAITQAVAAGDIVGIDLPTTTGLNWLQVWFEYEVDAS